MIRRVHIASLAGIITGIAVMLQPWWPRGFRIGFFITLVTTIAYIIVSHVPRELS
jgi:hypothetical protein